jgi:TolB protein
VTRARAILAIVAALVVAGVAVTIVHVRPSDGASNVAGAANASGSRASLVTPHLPSHPQRLLFTRAGGGLQVVDLTTRSIRPLQVTGAFGTSLGRGVWSPDGVDIAFQANSPNGDHVEVAQADGSHVADLTPSPDGKMNVEPAWSPDGGSIVFASDRAGTRPAIWTVRLNDHHLTQLTDGSVHDAFPSWSPDGAHIAFVRIVGDNPATAVASLILMNADGTHVHPLVALFQAVVTVQPAWSPDGRVIAYADGRPDAMQIFTVTPDGATKKQVSHDVGGHYDPAFSPDGSLIAFARFTTPGTGLWVMKADGTHVTQFTDASKGPLPNPAGRLDGQPEWQP